MLWLLLEGRVCCADLHVLVVLGTGGEGVDERLVAGRWRVLAAAAGLVARMADGHAGWPADAAGHGTGVCARPAP